MCEMHDFSLFLSTIIAPSEARSDIVGYLQDRLGYPVRKPLAKYIDEYNWYLAWQKP